MGIPVRVDADNKYYSSDEKGLLYNKDKTELLYYPASVTDKTYIMPDTVQSIGAMAAYGAKNLESVQFSPVLKTINDMAFSETGIKSLNIPDSVETIGRDAFYDTRIQSVIIGSGLKQLDSDFKNKDLNSILVKSQNSCFSSDGYGALYDKNQTTLLCYPQGNPQEKYTVPQTVTTITYEALRDCKNLKTIEFNNKITSIDVSGCTSLESIKLSDAVTELSCEDCHNLKLSSLPAGLKDIKSYAFANCYSLTIESLPDTVTSIGSSAFMNCRSIKKFHIGKNVNQKNSYGKTVSYNHIFMGCDSLKEITVDKNNTYFSSTNGVLYSKSGQTLYHYPAAKTDTAFSIPEGVTSLSSGAFYNALNLTKVTIPSTLAGISTFWTSGPHCGHPFAACLNIEKFIVTGGNNNYSVDANGVLYNKDKTELIAYPSGSSLTTYTLPATVTSVLSDCLFQKTKNLSAIYVEPGNTAYCSADGVLYNADCTQLAAYPHNKQDIKYEAPDTVKSFGNCVFNNHPYLREVVIPESATFVYLKNIFLMEKLVIMSDIARISLYNYSPDKGNLTIYANKGSTGEAYAKKYDIPFKEINSHTHAYAEEITPPTCNAKGYTTYTCECGYSYVADYVDETEHNHISSVTTPATHLTEGVMTYTCACGDTYTEAIEKTKEHSHTSEITTPATYLKEGVMTHKCDCGNSYTTKISKLIAVFTDSAAAELDGTLIICASNKTSADILRQASSGSVIKDESGKAVAATTKIGTGMTLTLPDGKAFELVVFGDIDGNGEINSNDARDALRGAVGIDVMKKTDAKYKAANVDGDELSASDARSILRVAVGLDKAEDWKK